MVQQITKMSGGIHPPQRKNTAEMPTKTMPSPEKVSIVMSQHIGAICEPTVAVGDEVFVGTVVGNTDKFVSVPIHSSVSGQVCLIRNMLLPRKSIVTIVQIASDGKDTLDPGIKPPKINSKEDFIAAIKSSGLVGLGGAGFPTWLKLSPPPEKHIDTLIINAIECEPYITCDYRQAIEGSDDLMAGIAAVQKYLDIKNIIIAIKDDKKEAIGSLQKSLEKVAENVRSTTLIRPLKSVYPLGAEKVLIKILTGKEMMLNKIPADVGCLVMNITTVSFISQYLKTGIPLTHKRITLDGSAILNPQNVMVPIGTSIKDLINFTGGYKTPAGKIIAGGPMTGIAIDSQHVPLMKPDNAVIAMSIKDAGHEEFTNCIRCGRCNDACPMNLMPSSLEDKLKANDSEGLKKHGALVCMECGCCAYVCPARRPLLQTMKLAKERARHFGNPS
ncbi:MAG: electron transport complex subunit RsxC [Clostridiales bacterium]